jgi:hypothetical protein
MKQLDFGSCSSTEWKEFKRIYGEMFLEELERKGLEDARRMLQAQVYEEFDVQIGAERYERRASRRDEAACPGWWLPARLRERLQVCQKPR